MWETLKTSNSHIKSSAKISQIEYQNISNWVQKYIIDYQNILDYILKYFRLFTDIFQIAFQNILAKLKD